MIFKYGVILIIILCGRPALSNDKEIKQQIIAESIASYRGNCPCPYNSAKNGSQCGKRSAYSRIGGRALVCYDSDITEGMLATYKLRKFTK